MTRQRTYRPSFDVLEDRTVPATFTVKNLNDNGIGSLRQAILDANGTVLADTVVFKAGLEGTILLTSGQIDITENLTVLGPGASKIAVSGNFASRIFMINNSAPLVDLTVKLQGLELRHGQTGGTDGGAVFSTEDLTLNKMVFTANQGFHGAAIRFLSDLTVTKCTITGNTAGGQGGGIAGNAVTITGSTITGNSASTNGGGIAVATATISGSTIAGNSAGGGGGGIDCDTATITGSTIAGNTASTNRGGGIACDTATITGSTISGNTASTAGGGGIYISGVPLTSPSEIRNCTISGNRSAASGGGIFSTDISLAVRNCTIAFNQAGLNGGGMVISASSAFLESCLVADNTSLDGFDLAVLDVSDVVFVDGCLIGHVDPSILESAGGAETLLGVDPLLAPLAFNGGKTQTHALKKGSPAINKGITSPAPNLPNLTTDQRGAGFKRKLGPAVDIGAFERQ